MEEATKLVVHEISVGYPMRLPLRIPIARAMMLIVVCHSLAGAQTDPTTENSVTNLVKQLADPQFAVRSAATEDLIAAEREAIGPVARALRTSTDVDVQTRCVEILAALANSHDPEVASMVSSAVDEIAEDANATGHRRARILQAQLLRARRNEAITYLRQHGAYLTSRDLAQINWANANAGWGNPVVPGGVQVGLEPIDEPIVRLVLDENWNGDIHDLERLKLLPEIIDVILDHPQLGAEELKVIAEMPRLTHLMLRSVRISDEDVAALGKLARDEKREGQLLSLSILYVPITDAALTEVESWKSLRLLSLVGTNVTQERVDTLRQSRPEDLGIEHKTGAFLGISPGELNPVQRDQGLLLARITAGGAAARAGLLPGDQLTRFDGEPVTSFEDLKERIGAKNAGDTIELQLKRGGQEITKKVTLGKWSSADWWTNNVPYRLNMLPANALPAIPALPPPQDPRAPDGKKP